MSPVSPELSTGGLRRTWRIKLLIGKERQPYTGETYYNLIRRVMSTNALWIDTVMVYIIINPLN